MKQISEKDILILMRQLDVLLEERQKEKFKYTKQTSAV
ncbi:hypothetical protein G159_12155 [Planococcus glaciei CHR43]|nr:hypothetical protein G159_12155 [Planococcus glaciei CHR43]